MTKRALVEAMEKSLGVVTQACRMVGVGRDVFYRYYNSDAKFREQIESIKEVALDFAESQLHKQIGEGIPTSTIFYLKTKGKSRGYVERQEVEVTGENLFHVRIVGEAD